jgi:hypothetical protein
MKNIEKGFFIFSLSILLWACGNPTSEKKEVGKILSSEIDTFYLGNKLIKVETVQKTTFDESPSPAFDTSETRNLEADASLAKRTGDTLTISISGNKKLYFVNDTSETDYANYYYMGKMKNTNQCLISEIYYEGSGYSLINYQTGDTTTLSGKPVLSPDKKYFICGNADLMAGFNINGFELFENLPKPKFLSARELMKWGPEQIKWVNDTVLLVKATVLDSTAEYSMRTDYFKLTFQ